ncbi:hypothetical protein ACH4RA_16660 [Streptomyces smyrnaeus]|uniref:hypothetical protein n=1 Tax=Streptomyces TaxID=1883 RepID=UPI000C19B47F|nr:MULTISPECIES: hypothetical protein [unclassified Streptomyces]MBQ0865069.1 hypothetical protein [Streptomyces sp. RK75]MBQ1123911.1 hypothetical protein [Streptomyces sp. B15]MBQ1156774.1 hypothetical protein [Streptomyces sp. A73]
MTAPAHLTSDRSRNRPAPGATRSDATRSESAQSDGRRSDAAQTRLPWWALLLPVLGFVLLLVLLVGGGQADAAQRAADSPLLSLLAHLWGSLVG